MRAVIDTAPAGALQPYLEAVAEALVLLNSIWIAEQIRRGSDPPCCTACAGPPWTSGGGVDYLPFHGDEPKGAERRYIDGPTMFAEGAGTCMDMACYDVAAIRVKERKAARVWTPPIDSEGEYHALVVMPSGEVKDPAAEVQARGSVNVGTVRRAGVVVARSGSFGSGRPPTAASVPRNIATNTDPSPRRGMFVMPFQARGPNVGSIVRIRRPESWNVPTGKATACRSCGGG